MATKKDLTLELQSNAPPSLNLKNSDELQLGEEEVREIEMEVMGWS